jgi:hypothetical protein
MMESTTAGHPFPDYVAQFLQQRTGGAPGLHTDVGGRWVAPEAIKHMHIGDQGLVFAQLGGETDHVVYIGACKKAGRNTGGKIGGKAGSTNVFAEFQWRRAW